MTLFEHFIFYGNLEGNYTIWMKYSGKFNNSFDHPWFVHSQHNLLCRSVYYIHKNEWNIQRTKYFHRFLSFTFTISIQSTTNCFIIIMACPYYPQSIVVFCNCILQTNAEENSYSREVIKNAIILIIVFRIAQHNTTQHSILIKHSD